MDQLISLVSLDKIHPALPRNTYSRKRRHERQHVPADDRRATFVAIVVIVAGSATYFGGFYYSFITFVSAGTLFLSVLVGTTIAATIIARTWKHWRDELTTFMFCFVVGFYGLMTGGAAALLGFNYINYLGRSQTTETVLPIIEERGYWGTKGRTGKRQCRRPYAKLEYAGERMTIQLPCDTELLEEDQIELTLSKGWLGYYIIESKRVIPASGASSIHTGSYQPPPIH